MKSIYADHHGALEIEAPAVTDGGIAGRVEAGPAARAIGRRPRLA